MLIPGSGEFRANLLLTALAAIVVAWFLKFTYKLVTWRLYIRKLQAEGMPMPPHNFLFGHLFVMKDILGALPKNAHPLYLPWKVRRTYPELGPNFYLDTWPFAPSILVLTSRDTVHQITNLHVLQKHPFVKIFVRPLGEDLDLLTSEGQFWKKWRSIFNPGFSPGHLQTLIPEIVKDVQMFSDLLAVHASNGKIFKLKALTDNLTCDVVSKVVLGLELDCQRTRHPAVQSLRVIIRWLSFGQEYNLFDRYNPLRPFMMWYYKRILDYHVGQELDKRMTSRKKMVKEDFSKATRTRNIIDLVLESETNTSGPPSDLNDSEPMDPFLRRMCIVQIRMFLYGGHDTTSTSICFNFYNLSQNSAALQRLQEEHTTVFGPNPDYAATRLIEMPQLLNQLPYTTAVIKESLRIDHPVTNSRSGEEGFSVMDESGRALPTGGFLVWPNAHAMHHDATYWPDPEKFMPERWLTEPGDPLHPVKGTWRPFEQGSRNCIAQDLAMIEMKMALVLTARKFAFRPAYDVLDAERGISTPDIAGFKPYQISNLQPRDDFPVWLERLGG